MSRKLFVGLLLLAFLLVQDLSEARGQEARTVTAWLIPLEPADEDTRADIDLFDRSVSQDGPVTVLNTRCRIYRDQLKNWNPEFDYPNFPIVKGQRQTIKALARFAMQNDVRINVRFVWWGQAFSELQKIRAAGGETCEDIEGAQLRVTPDVAQIGTTWVAYFAKRHAVLPLDGLPGGLKFYNTSDMPRAALRYTTDVRLIFYWKRMSSPADPPLNVDGDSWDSILKSLAKVSADSGGQSPPMAMPTAAGPNLLHDYVPLVRSGGGPFLNAKLDYADLTSDAALAAPRLLAARATLTDEKSRWHRLVAFPEITHEEAVHHFWDGEYFAVIEPAGFIKRWKNRWLADLQRNTSPLPRMFVSRQAEGTAAAPLKFWDYAGVAVPPSTFIGGSVLSLMDRGARPAPAAQNLIGFLAADEEYTAVLAELGNLPAQRPDYGLNIFIGSLGDVQNQSAETGVSPGLVDFGVALGRALEKREGLEHPPLEEWPTVLESQDVLESFQRIWRRIGEGNIAEVEAAAASAQLAINRHINVRTRVVEGVRGQWQLITVGLLLIVAGTLAFAYREVKHSRGKIRDEQERAGAFKERAEALTQVRKVRGFASSALTIVDTVHHTLRFNPFLGDANEKQALKARIISAGLQGWRRGQESRLWEPEKLESVVWRAILLAVESVHEPDLFRRWEQCRCHPETFLRRERILRDGPEVGGGCRPFYFDVPDALEDEVQLPFMFEQAMVCLLQNAIIASWDVDNGYASVISVELDAGSKTLAVVNSGAAIDDTLRDALNKDLEVADFEREVDKLLRGPVRHRPGIGLVEAYCIARQCYGGLKVDTGGPRVFIKYCAD